LAVGYSDRPVPEHLDGIDEEHGDEESNCSAGEYLGPVDRHGT
jgi:hypothetical protein